MMNTTLFRKEIKSNYILILIFIGVLAMYACMIVLMFDPKLGDSLKMMAESMPGIFSAFGMTNVGTTLLEFVNSYLYGLLFVAFPGVFIIILSGRLVVKYVDNGSMAYLLAVPEKRRKIVTTHAVRYAGQCRYQRDCLCTGCFRNKHIICYQAQISAQGTELYP